jgi:hypothetical protein
MDFVYNTSKVIVCCFCFLFYPFPLRKESSIKMDFNPVNFAYYTAIFRHYATSGVKGSQCVRPTVNRLSGENVGASTSHNPMGFHSLLHG